MRKYGYFSAFTKKGTPSRLVAIINRRGGW
nr:MAG TPA: hypothetical protein [Caudoviricetes sp.]